MIAETSDLVAPEDQDDPMYDWKRAMLGAEYKPGQNVRNWLAFKSIWSPHSTFGKDLVARQKADRVLVAKKREPDALGLAHEAPDGKIRGSADSMHSFWTIYSRALQIWYRPERAFTLKEIDEVRKMQAHGGTAQVDDIFERFAWYTHTRGNFIEVPAFSDDSGRKRNFNTDRAASTKDFWDVTLQRIEAGAFEDFFSASPAMVEGFRFGSGKRSFLEFIRRNDLEDHLDEDGHPRELWDGHLSPGSPLLPTVDDIELGKRQVKECAERMCAFIEDRSRRLESRHMGIR